MRKEFVRKLHALGLGLPEPGGRYFYIRYGEQTMTIPNNHEFSVPQLKMAPLVTGIPTVK